MLQLKYVSYKTRIECNINKLFCLPRRPPIVFVQTNLSSRYRNVSNHSIPANIDSSQRSIRMYCYVTVHPCISCSGALDSKVFPQFVILVAFRCTPVLRPHVSLQFLTIRAPKYPFLQVTQKYKQNVGEVGDNCQGEVCNVWFRVLIGLWRPCKQKKLFNYFLMRF